MRSSILIIAVTAALLCGCRSSIVDDPTTIIQYAIPERGHVLVTIENSYDTVVLTPVNTEQSSGNYTVSLDLAHLPEGVYFYTLDFRSLESSKSFTQSKKMLLIK